MPSFSSQYARRKAASARLMAGPSVESNPRSTLASSCDTGCGTGGLLLLRGGESLRDVVFVTSLNQHMKHGLTVLLDGV